MANPNSPTFIKISSKMSHDMPMPMTPPAPGTPNMPDMGGGMSMQMTLYWGRNAVILFDNWPGHSLGMYILSLFAVFFVALGVELLSVFQVAKPNRVPLVAAQAAVYAVKMALAYLVMLAAMSFNIGILIAVVLGHMVGFFIIKVRVMSAASRADPSAAQTGSKV